MYCAFTILVHSVVGLVYLDAAVWKMVGSALVFPRKELCYVSSLVGTTAMTALL